MKFHFTMIIKGNESINKKLIEKAEKNKELQADLIFSLIHIFKLAFELNKEDQIAVETFKVGQVQDPIDD